MAANENKTSPEVKSRTAALLNNIVLTVALGAALYFGLLRGKTWDQSLETLLYVAKVVLGLGFLIFIHELGHFVAAKLCNVRVEAFSIGFGPPVPGCHFKYGETEYKLALFPIGGYVKMPGEYPSETQEAEVKNDPRTFMNQSVGERMFIISAGVIMNMLFGLLIFIYVYTQGKTERAPFFGGIEPGSPAYSAGVRAGSNLLQVQDNDKPSYDDLFFASALASPGKTEIHLKWRTPEGLEQEAKVIPQRTKTDLRPVMGIGFPYGLTLFRFEEVGKSPATPGTPAAQAAFRGGDVFIGVRAKGDLEFRRLNNGWDYQQAEHDFRGKPMELQVDRKGETLVLEVAPAYVHSFGLVMEMGPILAVAQHNTSGGTSKFEVGDVITALNGSADFDPMRLPDLLTDLAAQGGKLVLTVQRNGQSVTIELDPKAFQGRGTWIESVPSRQQSPLAIPALGIAYQVKPTIKKVAKDSPAARAGLVPGQTLKEVTIEYRDPNKPETVERTLKAAVDDENYQWPTLFWLLQADQPREWALTFTDAKGQETNVKLSSIEDKTWPWPNRGFRLENQTRIRTAESISEAIALGWKDTHQFVGRIYVNLYSLIRGYLSPKLLSGPIEMVRITYNVAGLSWTEFLHFLAIISINLAVVNFLPIPVLDGGHMVILIIEKIRGKPVSERILVIVTIAGLCIVLCLMLFTIVIDITKFEWFQRLFG